MIAENTTLAAQLHAVHASAAAVQSNRARIAAYVDHIVGAPTAPSPEALELRDFDRIVARGESRSW